MRKWLILMVLMTAGAASSQDADLEVGRDIYMSYCVQCHGVDAKGIGTMAEILNVVTPDLTLLAERNDGIFPTDTVAMKIDGRTPILGHGGDMPLFGPVFDVGKTVLVRLPSGQSLMMSQTLVDLISYLGTVQVQ